MAIVTMTHGGLTPSDDSRGPDIDAENDKKRRTIVDCVTGSIQTMVLRLLADAGICDADVVHTWQDRMVRKHADQLCVAVSDLNVIDPTMLQDTLENDEELLRFIRRVA
jgi:hypothetical protein